MRHTKQRAAILTVLQQTDQHPTADWIHQEVRKTLPRVSLGTVYRALDTLCQQGMVKALRDGSRSSRYDGNPGEHAHIVCTACGSIADVPLPMQEKLTYDVEESTGFIVQSHLWEWYGLCPRCAGTHQ